MTFPPALVSVVVPARDAATTLPRAVLSALHQQDAPKIEVVIAVGPSVDSTPAVAQTMARTHAQVRVVPNPTGTTPAGLNRAIGASRGEVVVRLDAHAVLPRDYVNRSLRLLAETGAGNVGGRQVPTADGGFRAAVASAMRCPLGSGGAAYRTGRRAGPVETVYLGVFRRDALEAVGRFDERLLRNQDYELNHRLAEAGWTVWYDPSLAVEYTPRGDLRSLWAQYREYGRYKRLVMMEHPRSVRIRQLAPLAMAAATVGSILYGTMARRPEVPSLVAGGYLGMVAAAGVKADRDHGPSVAVALATMHWAWAIGFVEGPPREPAAAPSRRDGASSHARR